MKLIERASKETQAAVENIRDTFSGADGGVSFVQYAMFIQEMDCRAVAGDVDAAKFVEATVRFSRIIDVARKISKLS